MEVIIEKKSSLATVEDDIETFSLDTLDALGMYFKLKYSILVNSILVLDPCYMNTFWNKVIAAMGENSGEGSGNGSTTVEHSLIIILMLFFSNIF